MQLKDWLFVVAVIVVGVIAVIALQSPKVQTVVDSTKVDVGAIAQAVFDAVKADPSLRGGSPESFEPFYARQTITEGGNVFATSSQGTVTYTAANFRNVSLIQHTAASTLTATLPASSTMSDFIRAAGDSRTIFFHPITTGITLADGTGTELSVASSSAAKFCQPGTLCKLEFVRKTNTDIEVILTATLD